MFRLIDRETGREYWGIYWSGRNRAEVIQFGKTHEGNHIKVTCDNICLVKQLGMFRKIKPGQCIILDRYNINRLYYVIDKDMVEKLYKREGQE